MKNAVKSTSFLNNLDERDPLAKFIQSQRTTVVGYGPSLMVFSSSFSDLQDYFDRIIKHPGQMDLLITTSALPTALFTSASTYCPINRNRR